MQDRRLRRTAQYDSSSARAPRKAPTSKRHCKVKGRDRQRLRHRPMADARVSPMLPFSGRRLAGPTGGRIRDRSCLRFRERAGLRGRRYRGRARDAADPRRHDPGRSVRIQPSDRPHRGDPGWRQRPVPSALAWSAVGGAAEAAAAGMLYLALASGTMGVASPLAAVVGATIPVAVGVASGERVAPAQAFGMLLAFGAITLVAAPQRSADAANRRTAPLAVASGVTLAISFIAFSKAGGGAIPSGWRPSPG